jgi:hypothetical protein
MSADRDLIRFNQILRILDKSHLSPESRLEQLYEYIFESEKRQIALSDSAEMEKWDDESLERALAFAMQVISLYVHFYYDPSRLRVTYYKRQRRVASWLDQNISPILKERIVRNGGIPEPELFLNEPIFFMKREARNRAFPKSKNGSISLKILGERLQDKLIAKRVA